MKLQVITSSPEGFLVNSTLIYGEKDAVLIDAQFTLTDAQKVVDMVSNLEKNLTDIYITHFHPDHYFGMVALKEAFPQIRILAMPSTIKHIEATWKGKLEQWKPMYGDSITSNPIIPEPLQGTTITIEGERLEAFGNVQGDCADNSYIWIDSIKAVICGDIVYHGVYPWTLETTPAERREWINTINKILSFKPAVVVAGHKNPAFKDEPESLQFTKEYLSYYDEVLSSSKTSDEFKSKIKSKFPNLNLEIILNLAADAAFK